MKINTDHKNKLFFFLIITISFLFFSGFMFQSSSLRLRRIGIFPIIKYQINVSSANLGIASADWVRVIEEAANSWFQFGGAKIYFKKEGEATTVSPATPATINCSDSTKDFLQIAKDTIYVASEPDPDCTGVACTFIWSCGDEIQHADTQFNPEFASELAGNSSKLMPILLHEFGHASGLDHCATGDTVEGCKAKQRTDFVTVDPNIYSVMHRFYESPLSAPQLDDQVGVKKLYGEFSNAFPKTGSYALNGEEIRARSNLENQEFALAFLLPGVDAMRESLASLLTYVPASPEEIDSEIDAWMASQIVTPSGTSLPNTYTRPVLSVDEAREKNINSMNAFFNEVLASIPQRSNSELEVLRANSYLAVDIYYRYQSVFTGDARIDPGMVGQSLNWHLRIRKEVIDEQNRRNQ